jgi:hypothetical protein
MRLWFLIAVSSAASGWAADSVRLFEPRPAVRILQEPPSALINFWLKTQPNGPAEIEILDAQGALVAQLPPVAAHPGLNRVVWDMRYEAPRLVELRTTPADNPYIWEEERFKGRDTRPVLHKGIDGAQQGPIAAPGRYSVRLKIDGVVAEQPLEIVRPPDSHAGDGELQSSVRLQLRIRDDISATSDMTNQIEIMRKQLEDQHKESGGALLRMIEEIDARLQAVESRLISHADTLSDDKYYMEQAKLYLNFLWLGGTMGTGTGKFAGSADFGQTETNNTLVFQLEQQLEEVRKEYRKLLADDVPAYNRNITGSGIAPLPVKVPK